MTDETIRLGDRYELGGLLGRGGMAEVRVARDLRLGRTVAIKQLRTDLADDDTFHGRFSREAQSAASLNHPSIVAVYDTGEALNDKAERIPYIVMEYVEGHTLREVLRDGRKLLPERALQITIDILKALDYSHRSGIVHRDIKPANVMLTPSGQVKVMDFGIARAVADASNDVTQTAAVIGTAQYLSPEQARGETVDARSDIYSTGCLLYELLTGRPPFVGESPVSVAYQHVREEPRPASQLNPEVSASIDHVLAKALAKRVDDRYQSAGDMQADLERVLDGTDVAAPTQLTAPVTAALAAPSTPPTMPSQQFDDDSPRRTVWWGLLGLVALAAIAFGVWALALQPKAPTQVAVTDVQGMDVETATRALTNDHFRVEHHVIEQASSEVDKGDVISTDPAIGKKVNEGSRITLTVSTGPDEVTIPSFDGYTWAEAADALRALGLEPKQEPKEDQRDAHAVINTNPPAGTSVKPGSTVIVYVSSGQATVPDLRGQTYEDAVQQLHALSLKVDRIDQQTGDAADGTVLEQSIQGGQSVSRGTTVTLTVAKTPDEGDGGAIIPGF